MICKVCNNSEGNKYIIAKDAITKDNFTYLNCGNCGLLQLDEIPNNPSKYYGNNYYSFSNSGKGLIGGLKAARDTYELIGKGFIGRLVHYFMHNNTLLSLKYLNLKKSDRILDVGSGNGKEIKLLHKFGFNRSIGIDPFINEDIYENDVLIVKKAEIYDAAGEFDIITLHHSFEHMDKPLIVLQKLNGLLSDKGRLMIRIPVADSYTFKKYGSYWVQLDAPRHFYLHTRKSMLLLGNKAGFKKIDILYDSQAFQFWASDVNKSGVSIHTLSTSKMVVQKIKSFFKGYHKLAEKLNNEQAGDQAIFILCKHS